MDWQRVFPVVFILISNLLEISSNKTFEPVYYGNRYIDSLLETFLHDSVVRDLDPLVVSHWEGMPGFARLKTLLRGFSGIRRSGDCRVQGDWLLREANVTVDLVVEPRVEFDFAVNPGFALIEGRGMASADPVVMEAGIRLEGRRTRLLSFQVKTFEGYGMSEATGFTFFFNWLLHSLGRVLIERSRRDVRLIMERAGRAALAQALDVMGLHPFRCTRKKEAFCAIFWRE